LKHSAKPGKEGSEHKVGKKKEDPGKTPTGRRKPAQKKSPAGPRLKNSHPNGKDTPEVNL